jgi:hypothetical protein
LTGGAPAADVDGFFATLFVILPLGLLVGFLLAMKSVSFVVACAN